MAAVQRWSLEESAQESNDRQSRAQSVGRESSSEWHYGRFKFALFMFLVDPSSPADATERSPAARLASNESCPQADAASETRGILKHPSSVMSG